MNAARNFTLPILICVWLIFSPVAPVRSEDSTNQAKTATGDAREGARQRRAKLPFAKGTLQDLDLLRRQFKLKTEDGMRTFTYTARTYIFRDKEKITADNLKAGEIVAVRFDTDKDGNHIVARIKTYNVTPPADVAPPSPLASTNQPILDDSLMRDATQSPPTATNPPATNLP